MLSTSQVAAAQMAFFHFSTSNNSSALIVHLKGRAAAEPENESMQMLHEEILKIDHLSI